MKLKKIKINSKKKTILKLLINQPINKKWSKLAVGKKVYKKIWDGYFFFWKVYFSRIFLYKLSLRITAYPVYIMSFLRQWVANTGTGACGSTVNTARAKRALPVRLTRATNSCPIRKSLASGIWKCGDWDSLRPHRRRKASEWAWASWTVISKAKLCWRWRVNRCTATGIGSNHQNKVLHGIALYFHYRTLSTGEKHV